jgi:thioredoxin 1
VEKKNNKSSPRVLLLAFAVVIVGGVAYHFWPKLEGFRQTAKAALTFNQDVSLTGISYTETNPLAIVDGKIVHEGDAIGGVKVLKIHRDKVEFERSGRRWSQCMPATEEGVHSALPVLLQLGSHKCPPCRRMVPVLSELRTECAGKFRIRYIDVRRNPTAASKYGVRAIPTQIFCDSSGRELSRHVGFYSKRDILATWEKVGVKF